MRGQAGRAESWMGKGGQVGGCLAHSTAGQPAGDCQRLAGSSRARVRHWRPQSEPSTARIVRTPCLACPAHLVALGLVRDHHHAAVIDPLDALQVAEHNLAVVVPAQHSIACSVQHAQSGTATSPHAKQLYRAAKAVPRQYQGGTWGSGRPDRGRGTSWSQCQSRRPAPLAGAHGLQLCKDTSTKPCLGSQAQWLACRPPPPLQHTSSPQASIQAHNKGKAPCLLAGRLSLRSAHSGRQPGAANSPTPLHSPGSG